VLLQKTLLNIEGLGRRLYPELDLWETAKPYLERWMSEQVGPRAAIRGVRRELPRLMSLGPELPGLAYELMRRLRDEELGVSTRSRDLQSLRLTLQRQHRRLLGTMAGSTLVSLAVLLYLFDPAPDWAGAPPSTWLTGIAGLGAWAAAFRLRADADD
jgi:ubiquinone biosynthesis protein